MLKYELLIGNINEIEIFSTKHLHLFRLVGFFHPWHDSLYLKYFFLTFPYGTLIIFK